MIDLDALAALLDKNPHDGTDAAKALLALPALIAYVRELEQQVQACGIRPRGKTAAPEAIAAALAMRARCIALVRAEGQAASTLDNAAWLARIAREMGELKPLK